MFTPQTLLPSGEDQSIPLHRVFEAFKLLCCQDSSKISRAVLQQMLTMTVVPVGLAETESIFYERRDHTFNAVLILAM
jgi:hypothetical protein